MNYLGDFPVSGVIEFKWNTNDQTGASVTRSTDGTLKIYKGNSATERSSLAGVTQTEDFDAATGVHHVTIDTSDNTDAGFYAAGNEYQVVMTGMVIDTKTVNAVIAMFSIERAGWVLAFLKRGVVRGTVGSGASATIIPTSALTPAAAVTDQFRGRRIVFDATTPTVNLRGQTTNIMTSASDGTLTVDDLTTAPASGDTFTIF